MLSLYVHIPFCEKKCPYCDFFSVTKNALPDHYKNYFAYLIKELELHIKHHEVADKKIETIYFGGGTPSLCEPNEIEPLMLFIREFFKISDNPEITIEVNPKTITKKKLSGYCDLGFNRVSIGVQSFDNTVLKGLERIHSAEDAVNAIEMTRDAGFDNISIDLIYGSPHQTVKSWKKEIEKLIKIKPQHCSIYGLTIHEGTPFYNSHKQLRLTLPTNDEQADMFTLAQKLLTEAGYEHYEISNYALPSYRSRHNSNYWKDGQYLGLGPAAHSYINGKRFANPENFDEYINSINKESVVPFESAPSDVRSHIAEKIMINLRLLDGINIAAFNKRYNIDLLEFYKDDIDKLREKKLIEITDGFLKLTEFGLLFADEVIMAFF